MSPERQCNTNDRTKSENQRPVAFRDRREAALRKLLREIIRRADLTRAERDVTTYLLNLWNYHKNGPARSKAPGREKIAAKTRTSVRTVASVLTKLRDANVLTVVGCPNGSKGNTRYTLKIVALFDLCGCEFPEELSGQLVYFLGGGQKARNCTRYP